MIAAAVGTAAAEPANLEPQLHLGVRCALGDDRPRVGARVAVGVLAMLGDPCGFAESGGCRNSDWWPVGGPQLRVDLGPQASGVEVAAELGGGKLDVYDFGFFPLSAGFAVAGLRVAPREAPHLFAGGALHRALGVDVLASPTATRWVGAPFVAAVVEATVPVGPPIDTWTLAPGLRGSFFAGSF